VTGGQALGDTLKGFKSLAHSSADRNIVVWLNEYFGLIERDGKTFTEMLACKESESKIFGVVRIPKRNQDTFGRDIEEVIARKLTFEDAIRNGKASVMSKQRLNSKWSSGNYSSSWTKCRCCEGRNAMQDVKRLISEVAAQNGIRVEPDDPLFALVTINRIVLEEATQELQDQIQARISEFDASYQRAERRAGGVLAQIVKESAEQMRQGLQNDIHRAGLKACEFVHLVNEAHRRPTLIRWSAVGLAAGALLFGGGFWLGTLLH
jgi:hypothetical protein